MWEDGTLEAAIRDKQKHIEKLAHLLKLVEEKADGAQKLWEEASAVIEKLTTQNNDLRGAVAEAYKCEACKGTGAYEHDLVYHTCNVCNGLGSEMPEKVRQLVLQTLDAVEPRYVFWIESLDEHGGEYGVWLDAVIVAKNEAEALSLLPDPEHFHKSQVTNLGPTNYAQSKFLTGYRTNEG